MTSIVLINLPFASLRMPSLGLAQIKAVLDGEGVPGRSCRILYLNHDFAAFAGVRLYEEMVDDLRHHNTGLGDWLFRQVAFPSDADNAEQYLRRFYWQRDEATHRLKGDLLRLRSELPSFLQELIAKYEIAHADVVGLTSMFQQNLAALAMARLLKARNPKLVTVMGGANCETPMGDVLVKRCEFVDFAVSGSGLSSFPALLRSLRSGSKELPGDIPGVLSKRPLALLSPVDAPIANKSELSGTRSCAPSLGADRAYGEELDIDVGIEARYDDFLTSLKEKLPSKELSATLTFETSRGCWWGEKCQCTFCGMNGARMGYRAMRPDLAIRQFERLFGYSDRCSGYLAVDNIMPANYVEEVLAKLVVPDHVSIMYEVKADLSLQEMEVLSRSRVRIIQPGIESLATSTLKLMRKGTTAFQNVQFLKNCVATSITPYWNLLIGFPGEEEVVYERYSRFLPLLFHLPPPSGCYPVRFDRYSVYYAQMERYGLDLCPVDYYEYLYPWPEADLFDLAYYFTDRNMAQAQYFNRMIGHFDEIVGHVEAWKRLWKEPEPPRLLLKRDGDSAVVVDTRSGRSTSHLLSAVAVRMLELLHRPMGIDNLKCEMPDVSADGVEREFAAMVKRGLVFEENGRHIGLVHAVPGCPRGSGALGSQVS